MTVKPPASLAFVLLACAACCALPLLAALPVTAALAGAGSTLFGWPGAALVAGLGLLIVAAWLWRRAQRHTPACVCAGCSAVSDEESADVRR